jgi:DNA-binding transcriptional MerR regulator
MVDEHSIGALALRTGCKLPTIRYYEAIGLLPKPSRTEGNQRRYTVHHLERLIFIRHARALGFDLGAIRELLSLADEPDHSCSEIDEIARRRRDDIDARIKQLRSLRSELTRMIGACAGGKVAECRIIGVLSEGANVEGTRPHLWHHGFLT